MSDAPFPSDPDGGSSSVAAHAASRPAESAAEILVTLDDLRALHEALACEVERGNFRSASLLAVRLNQARAVPAARIPPGCMTMHAAGRYRDEASGSVQEGTLVYPGHERASLKLVSVASELGAALLGLSVGMRASWTGIRGTRSVQLLEILHQPEWALTRPGGR